jgi:hypothetical protein
VSFNGKREGDMEKTPNRQLDDEFVSESMETFLSDHYKPLNGLTDIINHLGEMGTEKSWSLLKQFLDVPVIELPTWEYERADWHLRALNALQNVTSVEVGNVAVDFVASFKFDYDDEGYFLIRTSTLEALDKAIELAVQCGREDIVEHLWRFMRYEKYATQGGTPSDIAALWIARIEGTSALFQLWKHFIKYGTVYTWFDWGIWHAIDSIGPEAHPELTQLIKSKLVDSTGETRGVLNNLLDRIK